MIDNRDNIGARVIRWLTYLLALTFIAVGVGILTKVLLPEPLLAIGYQRWLLGGVILVYGSARLVSIYLKARSATKNRRSEGIF